MSSLKKLFLDGFINLTTVILRLIWDSEQIDLSFGLVLLLYFILNLNSASDRMCLFMHIWICLYTFSSWCGIVFSVVQLGPGHATCRLDWICSACIKISMHHWMHVKFLMHPLFIHPWVWSWFSLRLVGFFSGQPLLRRR